MNVLLDKSTLLANIVAYSVRNDGLLIDTPRIGQLTESRDHRVTLRLSDRSPISRSNQVIGVNRPDGSLAYFGATIVHDSLEGNLRTIEAVRGGIAEQILEEEGRRPVLRERDFRFERSFSDAVYDSWEHAGILRRRVLDKVLVCPKCASLPTFRFGCQRCGSGDVKRAILVHHFACACVAPLDEFENKESLQCPKCQTKHLIAGTDFEYAPGLNHCRCCGWTAHELEQTGHCLNCDTRFPFHQAVEQEMVGYDVNR